MAQSPKARRVFQRLVLAPLLLAAFTTLAAAQIQLAPQKPATPFAGADIGGGLRFAQNQPQPAAPAPADAKSGQPDFSVVDSATGTPAVPKLEGWAKSLDELEQTLGSPVLSYARLDRARDSLDTITGEIGEFLGLLTPKLEAAKAQIDNLGPLPATGDPEPVAAQRAELQKAYGSLGAARNIAESARLRAAQLSGKVQEIRRRKFANRLFERVPEAHSTYTWTSAPAQLGYALDKAGEIVAGWWQNMDQRSDAIQTLTLGLLLAAISFYAAQRGVRHFRRWDEPGEPPLWRRSTSAAWVILLRCLPVAATVAFLYFSFSYQELMTPDIDRLAYSAMRSILIVVAVSALIATALAPKRPHWRLLPMEDKAASRIRWLVVALAAVHGLTLFLSTVRYVSNAPFTLTVAQSCISSVIIACLVLAILKTPRNAPSLDGAPEFDWVGRLRYPIWGIALLILASALMGYIGFARFASAQIIVTGTVLAVLYLLMIWIEAVGQSIGDENAQAGAWLKETAGLDQRRREQLALPVMLILKTLVVIIGLPLVLLQWGFDWKDISQWASSLFFGFTIGDTRISIAAILASLIVFALGYLAARLFQGWLDRRVLEPAGISGGTRNSIRTGVGYLGVVAAGLFAVSYAGLDLSNIALVAGALSVGIGLGLQGVVNNFVSGLILLVERPIKVGDWVVVGDEEGIVRKISVRSTEIETFDRANVVIPNAYFISEKVKNWTLHNYSGRIMIPVRVEYDSDPRRVRDILLKVAKAHPQVMATPEPNVYFEDFGQNALNFKLYAYTYDITKSMNLRTDLRINIFEALRAEAIEIPHGLTDVRIRDMEWLQSAFAAMPQPARRETQVEHPMPRAVAGNGSRAD
ncbi:MULTISPECIES: mechanosensitive ion channel domain-containing protein [Rhodomicrobium]|uniref:mechanosensitive ion channel family protein n=1 Tax=Rhodomicrobium TaxID=1068 RepID=UPI000B4AC38C|nr:MULTISPECIES: mechanosensitive ion channel domain-containing protein [Rhodomicrobium]